MNVSPKTEFHARVLKANFKDIVKDVDGYYVFWPEHPTGSMSAGHLLMLSKIITAANKQWDDEVRNFFKDA